MTYRTDEALIAAMDALVGNQSKRKSLGERGRAAYEKNWTTERYLSGYFKLIQDLSARREAGRSRHEEVIA